MQEERPDDNFSQGGGEEEEEEEKDNNDNEDCDEASMERTTSNALAEFRDRVEFAILGNYLIPKENNGRDEDDSKVIKLWGVPLLPSVGHDGTDTVLIKFLKAKRYDVHKAFNLLQGALKWRAEFWPDDKDHGSEEDSTVWFTDGRDTEGCPVCYTVLGRESRRRFMSTGDHSRYQDYLRWRIQCVEKGIQSLDFSPGGVDSFIQIIDLKNAPGITNREIKLIFILMDAAHPERPVMVFGSQHIEPTIHCTKKQEQIHLCQVLESDRNPSQVTIFISLDKHLCPVQYGGLKRENDTEFSTADKVLEAWIRTSATEQIKIPVSEAEVTVAWDVTVVGYDVLYKEEFLPDDDCSYTILLQEKKMVESIRNSFYIREPGMIVITIVNATYTKKKAFYRYKSRPVVPVYMSAKSFSLRHGNSIRSTRQLSDEHLR